MKILLPCPSPRYLIWLTWLLLSTAPTLAQSQGDEFLAAPFGDLHLLFRYRDDTLTLQARYREKLVLSESRIGLELWQAGELLRPSQLDTSLRRAVDSVYLSPRHHRQEVRAAYQEVLLRFEAPINLRLRAYDAGFAYRWELRETEPLHVVNERLRPCFPALPTLWAAWQQQGDGQPGYTARLLDSTLTTHAGLPLVATVPERARLALTQTNGWAYPRMRLSRAADDSMALQAQFRRQALDAPLARLATPQPDSALLTDVRGPRTLPWRIFVVAETDAQLLDQDLPYLLAEGPAPTDTLHAQPGAMFGPGWTQFNLQQVEFDLGCNMAVYRQYLKLAAEQGIPYLRIDSAWETHTDLTFVNPKLDLLALGAEARKQGVKLVVACPASALMRQLAATLDGLADWGMAGLVVQGADSTLGWQATVAKAAAQRGLLVVFEGSAMPEGLARRYPHVLGSEGMRSQWANAQEAAGAPPAHLVTGVFLRSLVGPTFQPLAAMRHGVGERFHPDPQLPLAHGTRAQQLALPLLYATPLRWLADMPTAYAAVPALLHYWRDLPAYWDQSYPQAGELGQYAVVARRIGEETWYLGAITNEQAREVRFDLSFLPEGFRYEAVILRDGHNADRLPEEWVREVRAVDQKADLTLSLAPGGGAVVIVRHKG